MDRNRLEEVAAFLREHRSNESNFETLYRKLQQEMKGKSTETNYAAALHEANEKAEVYRKAKETGGTAWPEFESFVSNFEKAVTEAAKAAD